MTATETHLKKSNWKTKQHGAKATKKTKTTGGPGNFMRLERFVSNTRAKAANLKRMYRLRNKPEAEVAVDETRRTNGLYLVVRVGTNYGLDPVLTKALRFLGLRRLNTAVFIKATAAMDKILYNLKDYVCWGSPDVSMVQQFIQKRGYAGIGGVATALSDNKMIEDHLGQYNIVCLEDIVHEIATVGPQFKMLKKWLVPFKIPTPKGGWKIRIGTGNVAKHVKLDEYGAAIVPTVYHNGFHQPAEFKQIVTPMI